LGFIAAAYIRSTSEVSYAYRLYRNKKYRAFKLPIREMGSNSLTGINEEGKLKSTIGNNKLPYSPDVISNDYCSFFEVACKDSRMTASMVYRFEQRQWLRHPKSTEGADSFLWKFLRKYFTAADTFSVLVNRR
jgi:hypothetical protein